MHSTLSRTGYFWTICRFTSARIFPQRGCKLNEPNWVRAITARPRSHHPRFLVNKFCSQEVTSPFVGTMLRGEPDRDGPDLVFGEPLGARRYERLASPRLSPPAGVRGFAAPARPPRCSPHDSPSRTTPRPVARRRSPAQRWRMPMPARQLAAPLHPTEVLIL